MLPYPKPKFSEGLLQVWCVSQFVQELRTTFPSRIDSFVQQCFAICHAMSMYGAPTGYFRVGC